MNVIETALEGVFILEPQVFGDARGWFMESWSQKKMENAGINVNFVQDNHSFSAQRGTLRGLHYQLNPMAQAKLLRVSRGAIFAADRQPMQSGSASSFRQRTIGSSLFHAGLRMVSSRSPIMSRCSTRQTISTRLTATAIFVGMTP